MDCGWDGPTYGFDFHHRIPRYKLFTLTGRTLVSRPWSEVKKEISKCDLLCAICHRKRHWEEGRPDHGDG